MGAILDALIAGYGDDFPKVEQLLNIQATDEDKLKLEAPIPELGRYLKSVSFLTDVTSGKAVGLQRFKVITEYFIQLGEELEEYEGKFKDKKIIGHLSETDKHKIRQLGTSLSDIIRAEKIEQFADHDTAAATDYIKILIARELPHLEDMIEGVHFANTSEDVMSNVFGIIANKLVYGHFMPALLDFCESTIYYVKMYEKHTPLVLPAFTHQQAAEPTTFGKKITTRLNAIDYLIANMADKDGKFIPFSGKLSGAVGNLTTHYAAYPDIEWGNFAKGFVKSLGLSYEEMTDQCVSYVIEANHFTTIGNILTQVIKLTDDFVDMASCPGQLFVKQKKKGEKGSSIMPNKSNAWAMEGAIKMLKKSRDGLFHYAKELPDYPHEGNMGRSYLFRSIGDIFMPVFIGLKRINREMHKYHPNKEKIKAFFNEYPGMSGSSLQSILKREKISGDAYRTIQDISINPDGSYANKKQFKKGLNQKMDELDLPQELRKELRQILDPKNLVREANKLVIEKLTIIKSHFSRYRNNLADFL